MKFIFVISFILCSVFASAQEISTFKISKGDILIYDVRNKGDLYYYRIMVQEVGSKTVYDWEMDEPKNKKGSVEIKGKAMSSSMKMVTKVKPDNHLLLEDATIVWISKTLLKTLNNTLQAEMEIDGVPNNKMTVLQKTTQTIIYKGTPTRVEVLDVSNQLKFFDLRQFWVMNNPDNPLITKLNMGFTVELIEIR